MARCQVLPCLLAIRPHGRSGQSQKEAEEVSPGYRKEIPQFRKSVQIRYVFVALKDFKDYVSMKDVLRFFLLVGDYTFVENETVDPPLIYLFEDDHQTSDSAALIYQLYRNEKIQ
jgi:hypothetical protein